MNVNSLRDPTTVMAAIREIDAIGSRFFLKEYGLYRSRKCLLRNITTRRIYDPEVIACAAHWLRLSGKPRQGLSYFERAQNIVNDLLLGSGAFEIVRVR